MQSFALQPPSLQHLAGVKIVTSLWNQRHIFPRVEQLILSIRPSLLIVHRRERVPKKWTAIEDTVKSNVWALPLPQLLKKQLLIFVKPILMEIIAWGQYRNTVKVASKRIPPLQLCWTMHGIIDYAKTAELMVKDNSLTIEKRYEIACLNCLEDEARQLFKSMSEERRQAYVYRGIKFVDRMPHQDFIIFFTCTLSGDTEQLNSSFQQVLSRDISINEHLFDRALSSGNRAGCEYFLKKLNQLEIWRGFQKGARTSLGSTCGRLFSCRVMYYLSLMQERQREDILRECIGDVLLCLLFSPTQSLFMESCARRYMGYCDYQDVLRSIGEVNNSYQNYDYSGQLFGECWRLIPAEHKPRLLDNGVLLKNLLETKRVEFIELVFNEAPVLQLLALSDNVERECRVLLDDGVIGEAALMELKGAAALNSWKERDNAEMRLRNERVGRLVDMAMEIRMRRTRFKSKAVKFFYTSLFCVFIFLFVWAGF